MNKNFKSFLIVLILALLFPQIPVNSATPTAKATPTPTPSPTAKATPTPTPSPTAKATPTPTPSPTAKATPTPTLSPTQYLGSIQANISFPKPTKPALAILDVGFDTTLPSISGSMIYEVCILEWETCPNGKKYMEGVGAAKLDFPVPSTSTLDSWTHGTLMAGVALIANPDINLVLIRIIGRTTTGTRQTAGSKTVSQALDWVYTNKDKLNIQAVTMAQGHHNLTSLTDYCPNTQDVRQSINKLVSVEIPVFLPAGNGRDYARIDWPACLNESIAVGAIDQYGEIPTYSNYDPNRVDFFALGNLSTALPGGKMANVAGTSASIQTAAGFWLKARQKYPDLTYDQIFNLFKSSADTAKGTNGKTGQVMNFNRFTSTVLIAK